MSATLAGLAIAAPNGAGRSLSCPASHLHLFPPMTGRTLLTRGSRARQWRACLSWALFGRANSTIGLMLGGGGHAVDRPFRCRPVNGRKDPPRFGMTGHSFRWGRHGIPASPDTIAFTEMVIGFAGVGVVMFRRNLRSHLRRRFRLSASPDRQGL